jgi:hypothetical protein
MGQDEQKRTRVDRSQLLLVLDRLDLAFSPEERKEYWAMHDLLTKLARDYDPVADLVSVYLTKRERYLLDQPEHAARFARVWTAAGMSGKNSQFRLVADFAASVPKRYATEQQRRAAKQAKRDQLEVIRKEQRAASRTARA